MTQSNKSQAKKRPTRYRDPFGPVTEPSYAALGTFLIKGDPTPTKEQAELLADCLMEGDPLADALTERFQKMKPGRGFKMLQTALDKGLDQVDDAPDELIALIESVEKTPLWYSPELIKLSNQVSARTGMAGEYVLSCIALMGGYRSGAANKPIAFTGALDYNAPRRLAETSKFTFDVSRPGGLERFAPGFKACINVRMMHAQVRFMLKQSPKWKTGDWGLPINQADLLGTNLLFSIVFLNGLKTLGFRFTNRETDAIMMAWRYIGVLMGIRGDILPATEQEGLRMSYLMGITQPPADEDSRLLGEALRDIPILRAQNAAEKIAGTLEMHLRSGFSRLILGDGAGDDLGLPNTPLKYSALLVAPSVFALETVRQVVPGLTQLAAAVGNYFQTKRIETITHEGPVKFVPPQELKREAQYA